MRLAIDFAFAPAGRPGGDGDSGGLQLDRVTAGTVVENEPMVRLLERRLGWHGVRRPSPEKVGHDEMFYEMTPAQWAELKKGTERSS